MKREGEGGGRERERERENTEILYEPTPPPTLMVRLPFVQLRVHVIVNSTIIMK
jgi:hypothetical protein